MRSPWRAAAVAVLLATLAACSSNGSDPATTPTTPIETSTTPLSAEPADGNELTNDDFTYAVPDGWLESDQTRALSLAVDLEDHDDFVDNVNVVSSDTIAGLEGAERQAAAEEILADASATHITNMEPVMIDGEQAVHTRAYFELSDPKYRVEQYTVVHDEKGYVVTFSFSPDVPTTRRDEISESILTTWKWDS